MQNTEQKSSLSFPKDFIFGVSESDLQTVGSVDPQRYESAQQTMWDVFAQKKKIDHPIFGTHKYTHWKEDIRYICNLGAKAYRTSVSMSRTLDESGKPNKKALKWYREYFETIKASKIDLHLCLYHWEAPAQFAKQGVLDKNFSEYYKKHTQVVLDYFSDLADSFIPINESFCVDFLSYYIGIHAPGYQNIRKFFHAYFATLRLQADAVRMIKAYAPKKDVGIVNIHCPAYIQQDKISDKAYLTAQRMADNLSNYIYSDPYFFGAIDPIITSRFKQYFPSNYQEVLRNADVHELINYYGINYYNSQYVKPSRSGLLYEQTVPEGTLLNSLGWVVAVPPYYPEGLTDVLLSYTHRYSSVGLKDIFITENGTPEYTPLHKGKTPQDYFRVFFMKEHLRQIQAAIAKGAPVKGYLAWSLIDNFEWQEGYKPESAFGLMALNPKTGERIPKKSFFWYKDFLKSHYE